MEENLRYPFICLTILMEENLHYIYISLIKFIQSFVCYLVNGRALGLRLLFDERSDLDWERVNDQAFLGH